MNILRTSLNKRFLGLVAAALASVALSSCTSTQHDDAFGGMGGSSVGAREAEDVIGRRDYRYGSYRFDGVSYPSHSNSNDNRWDYSRM